MFENAKWIAGRPELQGVPAPLMRKNFNLTANVSKATLYVCGLGLGVYWINGERVTDERLITPVSKYDSTVYYSVFPVERLLKKGRNTISAILGNGWYNIETYSAWQFNTASWRHHPKMLAQLDIVYADGSKESVCSNSTWQTADSPVIFNEPRRGETYDAREEQEGWKLPDFDSSGWRQAFVCRPPGGRLLPMDYTPIRIVEEITPEKCNTDTYDMGKNVSGHVRITVRGKRGDMVTLRYAERLGEDGLVDPSHICGILQRSGVTGHTDTYILKGTDEETWAPEFVYHGFRYVEIKGDAKICSVSCEVVHTDFDTVGSLCFENPFLDALHQSSVLSTRTNYHGLPTDCPHREQNGWTGDALMSCEQSLMNFDMHSAYRKWLRDFKDAQRPNGQIPGIIPTSAWGYNWGSGPAWDSALIIMPYAVWQYTGETDILKDMWDTMERYMQYLYTMQEGYLLDFGLGDWPPDSVLLCPTVITDTAFYYEDAVTMAICAEKLGKNAEPYQTLASNIRIAFRNSFIKGFTMKSPGQTAYACALYNHFFDADEEEKAYGELKKLLMDNDCHTDCGILGMRYLLEVLAQHGDNALVYKMIANPTPPSYAFWIAQGQTTLCEHWNMISSRNHHMFSMVDAWLYKYVAGFHFKDGEIVAIPEVPSEVGPFTATCRGVTVIYDGKTVHIEKNKEEPSARKDTSKKQSIKEKEV